MPAYDPCNICPRSCGIDRTVYTGACGTGGRLKVARAALHHWEEPCISGSRGSGAVFFSGCALHCSYCQNKMISDGKAGVEIDKERLYEILFELEDQGAHNINLVTGDHFIPLIAEVLIKARTQGLHIPVIFNCSGYETVEALKMLDGLIDIYLPDFKYMDPSLALRYSKAPDYPDTAKKAIAEMVRQCPECVFDGDGMIRKGVIVRHLLLPGCVKDAVMISAYLYDTYGDAIFISLMSQYTPMPGTAACAHGLSRRVTKREYEKYVDHAIETGIKNAYIQEMTVSKESFIPEFDNKGVLRPE